MSPLAIRAHAKVNLDLRILSTRPDGYHELATIFQTISLHDTLTIRPGPGPFELRCDAPGVPAGPANLVCRAAEMLWTVGGRAGPAGGAIVELKKRIPVRAGLGGGSADAAAALVGLRHLWRLPVDGAGLREVARRLGADVAFFLEGGTAEGRGRGDEVRLLPDLPEHDVLVVVPGFGVATSEAYAWYDEMEVAPSAPGRWPVDPAGWAAALGSCRNDLEGPVGARHPEIAGLAGSLRRGGARLASMSGSGSAVFALFDDRVALEEASRGVASSGACAIRAVTLGRAAYRVASGRANLQVGLPEFDGIV